MAKLIVSLHDQTIELDYPAELQKHIDPLFGPQTGSSPGRPGQAISIHRAGADRYAVRLAQGLVGDGYSIPELLDVVLEEVVHSLILELETAVALHSASIAWQGKTVLIAGPSGCGKTSLTGWFAARDFEFLSDELLILLPGNGQSTVSCAQPLLAKPGSDELVALLAGRGKLIATGANTIIGLDHPSQPAKQPRQAGLIIFPNFVAGSRLEFASNSPAQTGMKLMQCNLNARNLADHGLRPLTAFARNVPALSLTYGDYRQLDGIADRLVKFIVESGIGVAGLRDFTAAFGQPRSAAAPEEPGKGPSATAAPKTGIPEATPRKEPKKVTIGMATFDDYDGVYFSLQAIRFYHPEVLDDVEFLVIDNHPDGPCAEALKALENAIPNYRYVPDDAVTGTAIRDRVFAEAGGEIVVCMDCHVLIAPGALQRLIGYCDAHPDSRDLLQGPLVYDDLKSISTHFKPDWRGGMYGSWCTTPAGVDADNIPFEITMQGLGLFVCRRTAWPGFNPEFRGFGGEEGYIHEKIRRRGGRVLCLPFLRWMHRFERPMGTPYSNRWEDRLRNYLIGFRELGWNTAPIVEHFKTVLGEDTAAQLILRLEQEIASSGPAVADNSNSAQPAVNGGPGALPLQDSSGGSGHPLPDSFASVWDEAALAQQRKLLARVTAVAEAHQLALFLFWGTLLGHVREGRILPWDDDVDLALFDPEVSRFAAFRAAIEAGGLQIFDKSQDGDVWIKICDPSNPIQSHYCRWTWPFVDIYIYATAPETAAGVWPVLNWPRERVLPGRMTTFEEVSCWEPEQPLALLDLQYKGWRHLEKSSYWDHRWEARRGVITARCVLTDARGRKVDSDVAECENPLGRDVFLPLLRQWIDLSCRHAIRYSIFWGTLLGQLRNQRLIPYDKDIDVVVGKSGVEALYRLPGRAPGCVFNDELKDQPVWKENEIRLVVRRDIVSPDGPRYDHRGRQTSTQVDSCAFNGPLARLIMKLPEPLYGRYYWHLDVDLFTDISRFNPYPAVHEVDELPELEQRILEGIPVSCLRDPLPYIVQYYGADYMTPDHVYRNGGWVARGA